jgi:RNA polymerase sigma-70 factor (ECF subfamily)
MASQASSHSGESTSSSLIERVRGNSPEAWERLTRVYGRLVLRWCRTAGLGRDDLQDVFQEVFAAVMRGIGTFRRDRPGDTFRGWLRTLTRHAIADYFRRGRQAQAAGGSEAYQLLAQLPDDLALDGDSRAVEQEHTILLREVLHLVQAEFEPATWEAFWQSAALGRNAPDVAVNLEMTPAAVRQAKSRVLRRLRQELDGDFA